MTTRPIGKTKQFNIFILFVCSAISFAGLSQEDVNVNREAMPQQASMEEQLMNNFQEVEKSIEALKKKNEAVIDQNNLLRKKIFELRNEDSERMQEKENDVSSLYEKAQRLQLIQNDLNTQISQLRAQDATLMTKIEDLSKRIIMLKEKNNVSIPPGAMPPAKESKKVDSTDQQLILKKQNQLKERLLQAEQNVNLLLIQQQKLIQQGEHLIQKRNKGLTLFDQEIQDLKAKDDALSQDAAIKQSLGEKPVPKDNSSLKKDKKIQKKIDAFKKANESLEQKNLQLMNQVVVMDRQKAKLKEQLNQK